MKSFTVKELLQSESSYPAILLKGWIRTRRDSKTFSFIEVNDGSCLKNIQVIVDAAVQNYATEIQRATTGASIEILGELVPSQGTQKWEIKAQHFIIIGESDANYPLQKKGHSLEFLREIAHLRPRTNLLGAAFRVRSRLAFAIHQFFQDRGFIYVHTPIITASDCEGAGEMFQVTTLPLENPARNPDGSIDYNKDFFKKASYLTVSGQLEGETFACALSKIYTFGPTFRAENSHTSRHASEFWMIEPEIAFCNLEDDMNLAEEMIKFLIEDIMKHCSEDLDFFKNFVDKTLLARLEFVLKHPFKRVSYTEAVALLRECGKTFEYPVEYGVNLQSEHERYLTEEYFKSPVTLYNYPKEIKPFYMRRNNDGKTVAAMDLLVPGIGEIIGGSQREERLDVLVENMRAQKLNLDDYQWYLDLRRYGTVPHCGFGLGFERMMMFVTGIANIRDVIPFPRTPGNAAF